MVAEVWYKRRGGGDFNPLCGGKCVGGGGGLYKQRDVYDFKQRMLW